MVWIGPTSSEKGTREAKTTALDIRFYNLSPNILGFLGFRIGYIRNALKVCIKRGRLGMNIIGIK